LQNNLTQSQDKALRRISEMKEVTFTFMLQQLALYFYMYVKQCVCLL